MSLSTSEMGGGAVIDFSEREVEIAKSLRGERICSAISPSFASTVVDFPRVTGLRVRGAFAPDSQLPHLSFSNASAGVLSFVIAQRSVAMAARAKHGDSLSRPLLQRQIPAAQPRHYDRQWNGTKHPVQTGLVVVNQALTESLSHQF